jgi:integrase
MLRAEPPYSKHTIEAYMKNLLYINNYIDLDNANSVCDFIRAKDVSDLRKITLLNAYSIYCKIHNIQRPKQKLHGGLKKRYEKVPEIPSEEVINRIIDNANVFYSVIFEFLRDTGCRTIELIELQVDDLKNNVLTIKTAKAGGLSTRQVKISDKLLEKVKRIIIKGRTCGPLFTRTDQPLKANRLRKAMIKYRKKVVEKYNLPEADKVHLHTFRHFYASRLYQETKDLVLVKTQLGHRNIKNTEIYTHIINFNSNRYEAKALAVGNIDEICKMLTEGWNVVTTTPVNVFLRRNVY